MSRMYPVIRRNPPVDMRASEHTGRGGIACFLVDLLHGDLVLPAVPEVVFVRERFASSGQVREPKAPLVAQVARFAAADLRVIDPIDRELVKVRVLPTHRHLQHVVELGERKSPRDTKPTPHLRANALEDDLQSENHGRRISRHRAPGGAVLTSRPLHVVSGNIDRAQAEPEARAGARLSPPAAARRRWRRPSWRRSVRDLARDRAPGRDPRRPARRHRARLRRRRLAHQPARDWPHPRGPGRFRGLRLVHTHLRNEPLTRDDLVDLALLRLDLVAAIGMLARRPPRGPARCPPAAAGRGRGRPGACCRRCRSFAARWTQRR